MPTGYNSDQLTPVTLFDASGVVAPVAANVSNAAYMTLTAAGVGVTTGADVINDQYSQLLVYVNITAITGTSPTLTINLRGKDPASGTGYDLLVSAALTAVGLTVLQLGPGITAAANSAAARALPRTWHARATIAGTTPAVTATVAYEMVR